MTLEQNSSRSVPLRKRRFGFTLVEMLISVLIIGIMLGLAIPLYTSSQSTDKQTACQTNMSAIFQADESYRATSSTRTYTTSLATLKASMINIPQCPCGSTDYVLTVTGSGSTQTLTIACPNPGGHVTGKTMVTSDGQTFTFQ